MPNQKGQGCTVGRDFLAFWRLDTVDDALRDGKMLDYAGSNQYARVESGDTVWLVTVRDGRLRLVGRILVDRVTNRDGVASVVGAGGLWPADHYILPAADTVRPVADIDIHHLVTELRSGGASDRLTLAVDGAVNGQQIQAMRLLAGNSAQLLAGALG
jgi:hypothetical protein